MARIDIHVKVTVDLDPEEKADKLAAEICRVIRKIYGVRQVEVSSVIQQSE